MGRTANFMVVLIIRDIQENSPVFFDTLILIKAHPPKLPLPG